MLKRYGALALTTVAGGCASVSATTNSYLNRGAEMLPEAPGAWATQLNKSAPDGDWVAQFESQQLLQVVEEALLANPDIESATATWRAARASARAEQGRALPSLSGSASAGANEYGDDLILQSGESYGLGLSASWEPDIWGQVSSRVGAAKADLAASRADLEALQLSIVGAASRAWVDLTNANAQYLLALDELAVRERAQTLTERRFSAGVSTSLDVRLARSSAASARASIASSQQNVDAAKRGLEILLGRYPEAVFEAPQTPPMLGDMQDEGYPSDLLARRPDIAAAEARMFAAGLRADQARLALRPSLSFSASTGTDVTDLADVLDADLLASRALANLTAPIFSGGALRAEALAARERAQSAVANYASTILAAWQEVENARAADSYLASQVEALSEALVEATAAEAISETQYSEGLISIFDLINAQSSRISSESQLLSARAQRANNRISYHLALGGSALDLPALTKTSPQGTN